MSRAAIDLSARPFVNRRPVVRLSLLLWLVGALLLAGNVWLYWDFIAGRGNLHAQLREVDEGIAIEERRISSLSQELTSFDLGAQNEQVTYLNQRIDQRRFSWSRLFDELSDLLPRDVRLTDLAPASAGDEQRRVRRSRTTEPTEPGRVGLTITGHARNDQAILDFVDALFADPSFERPNLTQQREREGVIEFDLWVLYDAGRPLDADVLDAPEEGVAEEGEIEGEASEADAERRAPGTDGRAPRPARLGRAASSSPELS